MPVDTPNLKQSQPRLGRESIPNLLTMGRLGLTVGVIALLSLYQHPAGARWVLPTAAGLFIIAALTDALDGYLARKWSVVSDFGRVMDPFADKALVLGSFIVLAGPGFADALGRPVAGVEPWMVVVLMARELLVTSIRGVMESAGVSFGANWEGKAKMILQSIAVPLILLLLWIGPTDTLRLPEPNIRIAITGIVWLTVIVTVASGAPYVRAAMRAGLSREGQRP